jgi:hypothetical protein
MDIYWFVVQYKGSNRCIENAEGCMGRYIFH